MCGSDRPGCRAIKQLDQMCCNRCALLWDINDPDLPECGPFLPAPVRKIDATVELGALGRAPDPDKERQKIHDILNNEPAK